MSKRKEKLKGIAKGSKTDQWMGDYSAKGEYMDKKGHMGEGAIYKDEVVTVEEKTGKGKPQQVTKKTIDTITDKSGKKIDAYKNAKAWYDSVLTEKSLNPKLSKATAFKFHGKLYSISGDKTTADQV